MRENSATAFVCPSSSSRPLLTLHLPRPPPFGHPLSDTSFPKEIIMLLGHLGESQTLIGCNYLEIMGSYWFLMGRGQGCDDIHYSVQYSTLLPDVELPVANFH